MRTMFKRLSLFAAFAACIIATTCTIFAQSHERTIVAPPANGVYLGASAAPNPAQAMAQLESDIGRKLLLHVYFVNHFDAMGRIDQDPAMKADFQNGRIPVISWGCGNGPGAPQEATLPQIASGGKDGDIDAAATAFKRAGSHLFMVRFMWEMNMDTQGRNINGNGCYSTPDPTQDAHEYVAAQRHIADRFQRDGVSNVTWLWCPGGGSNVIRRQGADTIKAFYPGNEYVDWICFDGYDRGQGLERSLGSFVDLFSSYGKPIILAETGEKAGGGGPESQQQYIADLQRALRPGGAFYPYVKAICYFHQTPRASGIAWTLDAGGKAAFRAMGGDSYFDPPLRTARVTTP